MDEEHNGKPLDAARKILGEDEEDGGYNS